jgi:CheY-like chemotaxis protein
MSPERCPTDASQPERARCVLVVEDEVLVRMSVGSYLRECGYHVIEAKTADEALTVLETNTAIDIVFSDIQMPGTMDGFALAQWLQRERPAIRVLLTSGVVKAAEVANDLCAEEPSLLPKPYDHAELLHRIKTLTAPR